MEELDSPYHRCFAVVPAEPTGCSVTGNYRHEDVAQGRWDNLVLKALLVLIQDLFSASPLGDVFMPISSCEVCQFWPSFLYLALLLTTISYFKGVGEFLRRPIIYTEDTIGWFKDYGTYNYWRLELYIAGGRTALRKPGNLFIGFLEGDNVGKVATGRLSMTLDKVRSVNQKDPYNMSGTTGFDSRVLNGTLEMADLVELVVEGRLNRLSKLRDMMVFGIICGRIMGLCLGSGRELGSGHLMVSTAAGQAFLQVGTSQSDSSFFLHIDAERLFFKKGQGCRQPSLATMAGRPPLDKAGGQGV
ncbi:hypothetical protein THAOC_17648 [Thalassiosira oceanica]|uniref:Uncharacterized protein n=1 Tax=Thalassiosira oceanica TaxID=159749 RepID=K0SA42_THAOC|nr:hypothetical protein THAOC_17648 [Thalassiosira oceanica]|eukprot:EJK61799.1 hypothetical protein THAOC_17648 [Thalassiosira oceanica]